MLDTGITTGRTARTPKHAAVAGNHSSKTFRRHRDSDDDLSDDDQNMHRPAGTPSTRSRQGSHAVKDQQQGSKQEAAGRRQTRQRASPQQGQPDVIMIDSSSDEDEAIAAAPVVQRRRGRPSKAAAAVVAAATPSRQLASSDSEQDAGSSSDEDEFNTASEEDEDVSGAAGDAAAAAAASSDDQELSSEAEEGSGAAADSSSEEEPFELARGSMRGSRRSAGAAAAGNSRTPKAAATTPQHSRRRAATAEAAATPRSTRRRPAAAAAAEAATPRSSRRAAPATPSGRPVRSCTKAPAAQPSLATPLAKLSLRSASTPQPSAGKQLRGTAAAAAPSSSKTQRQRGGSSSIGGASSSRHAAVGAVLPSVVVDGEVFGPGDDVYLALDEFDNDEEEEEACEVCGSSSSKRGNAILECSTCLRGFHLRCLVPRLKAVPDGDWLCADCNAGRVPPPPNKLVTRWQKLLYGKEQLALVHVLGCVRGKAPNGTEEDQLLVRYYILPQETHTGRLSSHGARELFLGCKTFVEPAHAAVGRAYVHHPQHFEEREEEGNDVFLCAYEYDEDWKRFKLRKQRGADGGEYEDACPTTPMLAGLSRGRDDYSSEADDSEDGSEGGEDDYRPDYGARGKAAAGKRRRGHGQLPAALAAAAGRFAGLGAAELGQQQQQLEQRDAFARLHASMSLACVPASLPCRQEERGRLQGFVRRALHEDGGILYICGVPGTGKTALVKEVLAGVREEARAAGTQFASINCLQLPSPQHVFSRLWEKLSGQHMGPARARDALMQLFGVGAGAGSSRRRYSTIIVLDEIDMLMTKDQAVLYQLFDWPSQPGSRLAIIGISNTHDLDQRVLPRIASRLDQAKLAFAPYAVAQLVAIVQDRLESSGVAGAVEQAAVEIACRKVAAETGDVRRALEMLRRAVEIARQQHLADLVANGKQGVAAAAAAAAAGSSHRHGQQQQQQQPQCCEVEWQQGQPQLILRSHTRQAQGEMFSALHHQLLRSRSCWEKLLLVAVVVEARATGRSAVVMQAVAERAANSIASLVDLTPPSLGVLQHCLVRLAGVRLLLSDGVHVKAHVALNVDKDDLALAVKDDARLARLQSLL